MEGAHYFEILITNCDRGFKVGVSKTQDFDLSKSFCDFRTGYGFFSRGQLRNGSDSMGKLNYTYNNFLKSSIYFNNLLGVKYGKKCKFGAVRIGVFINVNRGQIGFTVNNIFHGVAFEGKDFKEGPFYPAVSLREGGKATFCKITSNPDDIIFN